MTEVEASVIWTTLPPELVLGDVKPELPTTVEVRVDGRILEVVPGAYGVGSISRLISVNPMDYLNPDWQPGALVPLFNRTCESEGQIGHPRG